MAVPDRIVAPRGARVRVGIGAVVVLVLVGLAVAVLVSALGGGSSTVVSGTTSTADSGYISGAGVDGAIDSATGAGTGVPGASASPPAGEIVFVHLLGAVVRPGLYQLRDGDRGVDAVAAAGGFSDGADRSALNLARVLSDGEQIYIPLLGEVPTAVLGPGGSPGGVGSAGGVQGKINLNTADEAALDTLPGVGPATAKSIIEWRQTNGRFSAIEDLMSVSGIGEKTFADLEKLVTV